MTLFEAIESGNGEKVRILLAQDRSLAGSRSATGVSAVLWARYRNQAEIVDALLAAGPRLDVFDAAGLGRLARLGEIVDADPEQANAWSADGFTPLGLAAFFGQPAAVALLIARGADVHAVARNPMRVQPLHAATAARSAESVRLILEAGADPDAEQQGGWTAVMAARRHGDEEIIRLLLAHGAQDRHAVQPAGDQAGDGGDQAGDGGGDGGGGGQAGDGEADGGDASANRSTTS